MLILAEVSLLHGLRRQASISINVSTTLTSAHIHQGDWLNNIAFLITSSYVVYHNTDTNTASLPKSDRTLFTANPDVFNFIPTTLISSTI